MKVSLTTKPGTKAHTIRPFINDWCIWELPTQLWKDPAIQKAIIHAYELGWEHAYMRTQQSLANSSTITVVDDQKNR